MVLVVVVVVVVVEEGREKGVEGREVLDQVEDVDVAKITHLPAVLRAIWREFSFGIWTRL